MRRRVTRSVQVGGVQIGGSAPIAIQSMSKAPWQDVPGTLAQIREAADLGCAIMRCAVPSLQAVDAFAALVRESPLPLVADIHFDWRIAVAAVRAGAAKIRINPGNMAADSGLDPVIEAVKQAGIPVRIGLNSGSVKRPAQGGPPMAELLARAALDWADRLQDSGLQDLVISVKSSDVFQTIEANRLVAKSCDLPLHLGVTAAGPEDEAMTRSAIAIGGLLADGIGDTIRLSFTGPPSREVLAGRALLSAAGLRRDGPRLISCPTCGRCSVDLPAMVEEVRRRLPGLPESLTVAVMGCEVNGPGEARDADIGMAAAGGRFTLFASGQKIRCVPAEEAVDALLAEIAGLCAGEDAGMAAFDRQAGISNMDRGGARGR